ncbi:MAG: hypothetical protein B6U95_03875 [Thermofilum sp. ex4484_82]|nr:MAG: hypothetical protein B6U95_03875 [Thermofilum sp. ex4484_82]OYT38660.1 MAG: hypothetical protein B6U96_03870 [Archaeoglobales archaeon ex4484_92]
MEFDLRDVLYHLSEIIRHAISLLRILEEEAEASKVLECLSSMDVHSKEIPPYGQISSFKEHFREMAEYIKNQYISDLRKELTSNDRTFLRLKIVELLERAHSLMVTGIGSFQNPSKLEIPVIPFPSNFELTVKIGSLEKVINRTFVIGRVGDFFIGLREFPYRMSFEELIDKLAREETLRDFPVMFSSKVKLEMPQFGTSSSRVHAVVYYDEASDRFRVLDVSRSFTIVEVDGYGSMLIGARSLPKSVLRMLRNLPVLMSLPLGNENKIWIDPLKGKSGTPVEIIIGKR